MRSTGNVSFLAAAAGVLFSLRLLLSLQRTGPVVLADEAGYLANARVLAGGAEFVMGVSPFYRAGYSLLLAPVLAVQDNPALAYGLVLGINAVLAASLVPLLHLLLTRGFGVPASTARWAAVAGATYPTVTVLSQVAMSENLLFPLVALWLLCLIRMGAAGGMGWAISSGVAGAALWAVHGRMVVAVGVTAMAFLVAAKRRLPTASLLAGIAALATGLLATRPLQELARKRNYDGRRVDEAGAVLRGLDDPEAILAVLRNLVGHTWYLAVATAGLAAVVGLGAAQQGLGRRRTAVDAPSVLLLATTAGLLVISAAWFATVTRPDQLIYGRYVEPVTPVLVAVGLTRLSGASGRRTLSVVLPALGALTVVVAGLRAGVEVGEAPNRWNVAALPFLTSDLQPAVLMGAGLVAIAAGVALALAGARGPAAVALVAIAVFVPVTAVTQLRLVRRQEQRVYPSGWTTPASQLGTRVRFVGYDDDAGDSQSVKIYQWFMPTVRFRLYDGESEDPPVQHYFTTRAPRGSARPLWHDSGRGQTLWMMSSEPPRPGRRPAPAPSSGGGAWGKIAESGTSLRGSRARQ